MELQRRAVAAGWPLLSVAAHPGFAATNLISAGPASRSKPARRGGRRRLAAVQPVGRARCLAHPLRRRRPRRPRCRAWSGRAVSAAPAGTR
nr:hypothetical protein [Angustibacter aerolatus]